tara:strand:+ start:38534 stop:39511 length:978 start_codon:yes stop_codon:yes gene_type:complete
MNTELILIVCLCIIVLACFVALFYVIKNSNIKMQNILLESKETKEKLNEAFNKMQLSLIEKNNEVEKSNINSSQRINSNIESINNQLNNIKEDFSKLSDLQKIFYDKQNRGYFGEQKLHQIIHDKIPNSFIREQETLSNGARVDFAIEMPKNFLLCIDSKFPLENYKKLEDGDIFQKNFKNDIKKHINDISKKYIIKNETLDYAIMFLPAESIYYEIHKNHSDLIEYGQSKNVILVSPNTIMTIMVTSLTIIKDDMVRKNNDKIVKILEKIIVDWERLGERIDKQKKLSDNVFKNQKDIEVSFNKLTKSLDKVKLLDLNMKEEND